MPPAARVGDLTAHPGVIGPPGVVSVLIGGRPAATVGTPHACMPREWHTRRRRSCRRDVRQFSSGACRARVGDLSGCGSAILPPGAPDVLIGG